MEKAFLVDFYHVCDDLAAAGDTLAGRDQRAAWMAVQKDRLKENGVEDVTAELQPFLEDDTVAEAQAAAHRYLTNRPGRFNEQDALAAGLPIGSAISKLHTVTSSWTVSNGPVPGGN